MRSSATNVRHRSSQWVSRRVKHGDMSYVRVPTAAALDNCQLVSFIWPSVRLRNVAYRAAVRAEAAGLWQAAGIVQVHVTREESKVRGSSVEIPLFL